MQFGQQARSRRGSVLKIDNKSSSSYQTLRALPEEAFSPVRLGRKKSTLITDKMDAVSIGKLSIGKLDARSHATNDPSQKFQPKELGSQWQLKIVHQKPGLRESRRISLLSSGRADTASFNLTSPASHSKYNMSNQGAGGKVNLRLKPTVLETLGEYEQD